MEAGGLVNAFGNGITFPFVAIYLHNVRGFSLGTAGLVLATNGVFSLLASPVAGWLSDRVGGRITLAAALVLMAVGVGSLALVQEPWQAYLSMALVGWGNGSFWPSQSTMLAGLAPRERRHAAYALQRVSRNLGIGLGGLTGGLIATTTNPTSFTVLFLVDAITFLAFVVVLAFVPDPELPPQEEGARPGRYLDVVRDRLLLGIVGLNVLFVSAGYAQMELLPVFAKNETGVTERAIGVIFLVNTVVIVLAQLPIAHALEGRRRMPGLALMTVLWAVAWLIVFVCGATLESFAAATGFALAGVVFGLGECFQGPTQGALVADLAPARLRGRYMALSTMSWEIGFVIGPALGGFVLDHQPLALWPLAAAGCLIAGVGALALERGIPGELRLTPA
jgi:predicted MFS family arabinose efflux permease